jgi:hypothetical protein
LHVGDSYIELAENEHYVSISNMLSKQMLHMLIVHPAATHQVSPFSNGFIQIGTPEECLKRYYPRLNRMCPVPFRESWSESLWDLGLQNKMIVPLPGFGISGYVVSVTDKKLEESSGPGWATIIQTALTEGVLK